MIHSVRRQSADGQSEDDRNIDARLARADPAHSGGWSSPVREREMASLREAIMRTPVPQPEKRRRWWHLRSRRLIGAAAVLVAAGIGWSAGAHTGFFGAPGMTENDPSEFLQGDSPDIVYWVNLYTARYALPPDGSWNGLRSTWPKPSGWGLIQAAGIEGEVSSDAYCQWRMYWITGYDSHDPLKMAAAQKVMDQYPTWPITIKTSDPQSAMPMWHEVARLARSGNAVEFKRLYPLQCGGADMKP